MRTYAPDVALVDLRMPGLSGADVARAVRARYPSTRVVILSAYDDDEIVQLAIAAGATGYVTKDSTPEEIVRAVYRAAEGEPRRCLARLLKLPADPGQLGRHLRPPDGGVVAAGDRAEAVRDAELRERPVEGDVLAEEAVGAAGVERRRDRLAAQRGGAAARPRAAASGRARSPSPSGPSTLGRVGDEVARPAGRDRRTSRCGRARG